MTKTLIVGASGQFGTELTDKLRELRGRENVIASDVRESTRSNEPFERLDIMDKEAYHRVLKKYKIEEVYHLAAILSAKGEQDPLFAWNLNMQSLLTVLESGRDLVERIYWPSSIAVFGKSSPKIQTPQSTVMDPNTVYGISKLAGERWCEYYFDQYGVDVRSLRYPGLIGYKSKPGGGTTDYAVDIFFKLVAGENFSCFLKKDTMLPMMYMEDAVNATIKLMESPASSVKVRSSYNLAAINFTPAQLTAEINSLFPAFKVEYAPDFRQEIADSWPDSIDDSAARQHWGWEHKFDLKGLVHTMVQRLKDEPIFN
jgi:nucleoside-diphosphate-sugar epimerase